jgi:transcriptional regulator with XRE-family HTH domain
MTVTQDRRKRAATLGATIHKARRMQHLQQGELARLIGLSNGSLSRIENDKLTTRPRLNTLRLLAEVLELEYALLLKLAGYAPNGKRP